MNPAAFKAAMDGDFANAVVASTPGGIEAQEARGQSDLCSASKLPKDCSEADRKSLEDAGVVFSEDVDDLFVSVALPDGWKLQPTDHSMWSDLLDQDGSVRAQVFYKAAFYDRTAHFQANSRFYVAGYHDRHEDGSTEVVVMDGKRGAPVERFGRFDAKDYEARYEEEDSASAWLDEHYPNHRDCAAYWSD